MNPICSINQAIKQFKGDLKRISAYCKERGIKISQKHWRHELSLCKKTAQLGCFFIALNES